MFVLQSTVIPCVCSIVTKNLKTYELRGHEEGNTIRK